MKKGQVSVEYMLVIGFMFLLLTPLLILYAQTQQDTTDRLVEAQLSKAGHAFRDTAERVYYAGEPAQEQLTVQFPPNIRNVSLVNTSIIFTVQGGGGTYELPISTLAPLNGTVGNWQGVHTLTLTAMNGVVEVHE
jgi:hypothetical protein